MRVGQKAERELLARAIKAFEEATGTRLQEERIDLADARWKNVDAKVLLEATNLEQCFAVEVKRWVNQATVGAVAYQMLQLPERGLLVTEYVNMNLAERLKAMNIHFLDTLGNTYVNVPPLFIYVTGRKPPMRKFADRPTRAFQPTGLKALFALLCKPDLANEPYRTIAEAADVARGTVGWVLADLKRHGNLLDVGKQGRRLIQKHRLIERWVAAYPEQLRHKLAIGRYTAPDPKWWEHTHIQDFHAYWGGEVAGALLTRYLKPEVVTIYVRDLPGRLLAANRLRKDEKGNVEVLKAFWTETFDWGEKETVHPLLAYADLIATGDARNLETAKRIYDDEIIGLIRED